MSFLTDHREIHLEVLGRRVLEVHPASVDPLVVELDRLQGERGRLRHGDEVGPGPHGGAVRPVQGLVESPSPHVETAYISHHPLNHSRTIPSPIVLGPEDYLSLRFHSPRGTAAYL